MDIDPLDAVIQLALTDAGLAGEVGSRISDRHHYGQDAGDWPQNEKALTVSPAGGVPDLDNEAQRPLLDFRCYGDTFEEAGVLYKKWVAWVRSVWRETVAVESQTALVYQIRPTTEPARGLDDTARAGGGGMPFLAVTAAALVSECEIV